LRRIGQAAVLAAELDKNVGVLYAHFLHAPASVARYAAFLRRLPWGFSAHAKDIWLTPDWDKQEKIISAEFGVTCTAFGADHLRAIGGDRDKIALGYHGLDLKLLPPPAVRHDYRDGSVPGDPVRFLSVGRLVEKKGFDTLIAALALLPPSLAWQWDHVGAGPLDAMLTAEVVRLGLADKVFWHGLQIEPIVIAAMRQADLFVLPCRVTPDGDRDGLPNVLMEAASQKLAILATPVAAIPEFVEDAVHGVLVRGEPAVLAKALVSLARDPERRTKLADAAYRRLEFDFRVEPCLAVLETRLRNALLLKTDVS
jgi:glycosyltransferase involved in cell wall biosynthesis